MRVIFNDNDRCFVSEIVSVNVTDCIQVCMGLNKTEILTYDFNAVLELTDSNNDKIYVVCDYVSEANAIAYELFNKGSYSFIDHSVPVFYYPDESDIAGIEEAQLKYLSSSK